MMERKTIERPLPEERVCRKHGVMADPVWSRKKNCWFYVHTTEEGRDCWVNSEEEDDAFREKQVEYGLDNLMGNERKVVKYD